MGWAAVRGPRGEGEKKRKGMGCRAAEGKREGEKGWAGVAHAGERRGKGAQERERERELGCWDLFPFLLIFFFFSTFKLFKQFHLNSNEFKFKLYTLHTNKTNAPASMHKQVDPIINFNYLRYKITLIAR
jgi:hypothetical protein